MFLGIDIGNTSIEFAFLTKEGKLEHKFFIHSKPLSLEELALVCKNNIDFLKTVKYCYISSVVPNNNTIITDFLKQHYNINAYVITQNDFKPYITLAHRSIETVGMDILCKSLWASKILKANTIILDVGTATVVQYVKNNGELMGAGITIGLASIYKYLNSGTALLPNLNPTKANKVLGFNTQSAIEGGVYFGYIGLVVNLIKEAINESNCYNVYLTGGLSDLIFNDVLQELQKSNAQIKLSLDKNIIFYGIFELFKLKTS
jgi:type III pantothenate kinase